MKEMEWNTYPNQEKTVCKDIDTFLTLLTSFSKTVISEDKLNFIYRGVSDDSHKLIPTALRKKEDDEFSYNKLWSIYESNFEKVDIENRDDELLQRKAELCVVQSFYQYAEKAGLALPQISDLVMRDELLSVLDINLQMTTYGTAMRSGTSKVQWPPKELLPIFGLAQHYGLPTRLLDWSRSPLVAAYFSASGAIKRLDNGDDPASLLCIYATVSTLFSSYSQYENTNIDDYPFRVIQPSSAENPNLKLQQGVFTAHVNFQKIEKQKSDRREIHEISDEFKSNKKPHAQHEPIFFTLYLPIEQAPKLLVRLNEMGYSANRIYDGYVGAVKAVEEESMISSFLKKENKFMKENK